MSDTSGSAATRPSKQTHLLSILVLGCVLAVGAQGWHMWQQSIGIETTDDAFIEGHVLSISARVNGPLIKVLVDDNQEVKKGELLAVIDPEDYRTQVDRLRAVLKTAKERRRFAQVNVSLVSVTSEAGIQQAAANLDGTESGVARAETAVRTAHSNVEAARAHLQQAQAQVPTVLHSYEAARAQIPGAEAEAHRTAIDLKRYERLYTQDEVSRQQLDEADTVARAAAATLDSARQRAQAAESQIVEAHAQVDVAQRGLQQAESVERESQVHVAETRAQVSESRARLASARSAPQQVAVRQSDERSAVGDVEEARAALHAAELNLSYTRIYAPESGRITRKAIELGTYVQPGQPLVAIVQHDVWVVANFKEFQITRMHTGQSVNIRVDAFPDLFLQGHVQSLQAGSGARYALLPPENATGNHVKVAQRVPVKILFDEPLDKLMELGPGLSVTPDVKVE